MMRQVEKETEKKMKEVLKSAREEFKTVRTGRARPSLVENIKADYYGTLTPIQQMAKVVAPEPRLIVIDPWDKSMIENIEKAIMKEDIGLTPSDDGEVIRINIPKLTEERRKELVKVINDKAEDARVAIRNIRRDANDKLEKMEDDGEISEDDYYRGTENIQELTDEYIDKIDKMLENKKEEIMTV
ncbi:MAG: ribosome recycling factor [Halanaerobiaceae bacterium]